MMTTRDTSPGGESMRRSRRLFEEALDEAAEKQFRKVVADETVISRNFDDSIPVTVRFPEHRFVYGELRDSVQQQPESTEENQGNPDESDEQGDGADEDGQEESDSADGSGEDEQDDEADASESGAGEGEGDDGPDPSRGEKSSRSPGKDGKEEQGQGQGQGQGQEQGRESGFEMGIPGDMASDDEADSSVAGEESGNDTFGSDLRVDRMFSLLMSDIGLLNLDQLDIPETRDKRQLDLKGRSRHGPKPLKDSRATVQAYLVRRIATAAGEGLRFERVDERFHRIDAEEEKTFVRIFLIADTSGSMNEIRKYLSRGAGLVIVTAMRRAYDAVEVIFVIQDVASGVVTEDKWFSKVPSGGTQISAGFKAIIKYCQQLSERKLGNNYAFLFSDGENQVSDNPVVEEAIGELLDAYGFNLVGVIKTASEKEEFDEVMEHLIRAGYAVSYETVHVPKELGPALIRTFARDRARKRKGAV